LVVITAREGFCILSNETVDSIRKPQDGVFIVTTLQRASSGPAASCWPPAGTAYPKSLELRARTCPKLCVGLFLLHQGTQHEAPRGCLAVSAIACDLDSVPVEITETRVVLDINGSKQELPNDFVWIFAGGVAPNEFLKKIVIQFGVQDLTREAFRNRE
jgi:hypothetical protein